MFLSPSAVAAGLCAILAAAPPPKKVDAKPTALVNPVVRKWMQSMSLRDEVAQLIVMPIYGEAMHTRSANYRKYQHFVRDLHVGGVIVTGHVTNGSTRNAEPYAMAALLNRMQKLARVPLLVAADFERGASMRVNSATNWPYNMAFTAGKDLAGATFEGAETAREARAMGVNWVFAPFRPPMPFQCLMTEGTVSQLKVSIIQTSVVPAPHTATPLSVELRWVQTEPS